VENQPGDGKSNPFGNGAGGAAKMASSGNDFLTNPSGSGGKGGAGQPDSKFTQSRPQQSGSDPVNAGDKPPGPSTAAEVVTPADLGGTQGVTHKPFKLGSV
jgi:hypothetical protein